jgi:hypothetical protein
LDAPQILPQLTNPRLQKILLLNYIEFLLLFY